MEIGNGLPNRKKCFGELFGPVMGIKSVMNLLAGNPLFVTIQIKSVKTNYREIGSVKKITDTDKMAAENYLEIGNRLTVPKKIIFRVYLVIFLVWMVILTWALNVTCPSGGHRYLVI